MSLCRAGSGGHKVAQQQLAQPPRLHSGGLCPGSPTSGFGTIWQPALGGQEAGISPLSGLAGAGGEDGRG